MLYFIKHAIIAILIFLSPYSLFSAEKIYTLKNVNFKTVVQKIQSIKGTEKDFTIPSIVKDVDLRISGDAYPKHRYYHGFIVLREEYPIIPFLNLVIVNSFNKNIEFWGVGKDVIVKASVNIELRQNRFPLRFLNRIKNREISNLEWEILNIEEEKIREFLEN